MTEADRVYITPPTNTSARHSRRSILGAIAASSIAGLSPAIAATLPADPIYAAIDAFRQADASCVAIHGDIPDELMDQRCDAYSVVLRTRPTTPAGLAALTTWAREQAVWLYANASGLHGEDLCALTASIDDATRGMSGLKPWSPPLPAAVAASTPVRPHPDAELLALADQYAVAYNRYSDLSRTVDRMDEAARGYQKANRKLDSAERAYRRIEDRIADIRANTTEGMLAKVKCAQAYNETERASV